MCGGVGSCGSSTVLDKRDEGIARIFAIGAQKQMSLEIVLLCICCAFVIERPFGVPMILNYVLD